ncbi:MAG: 2-octaprenyl-6-methoxyphenyl hydroxylase [Proteobacteria bacterium]|nr:2-octaprenyl-6-methoxyphenyl hydroxylase [Pseudomonadota bacterium]
MTQKLTIIGGGLVGASLACALRPLDLDVTVLEETPLESGAQPSFDERTIALTYGSRKILEAIGIWDLIAPEAGDIKRIHVSNRGHAGFTRLDRNDIGTEALGYVVPTRAIGKALIDELHRSPKINFQCPSRAERIHISPALNNVTTETTDGTVSSSLVVLADGGRSPATTMIDVNKKIKKYSESALVGIVGVDRNHNGTAFERFTEYGPLALLPLVNQGFALAWTLPEHDALAMTNLPTEEFLSLLQDSFGDRAGFFTACNRLTTYPLSQVEIESPVSDRCVAVGNAAHIVHPVAGQGFNLGLKDIAYLSEAIAKATLENADIGETSFLQRYADNRRDQTRRVLRFTDGLLQLFANEIPGLRVARNIGLNLIEIIPPAKRFLLRRTVGIAGPLPRLARGLPLQPQS